MYKNLSGWQSKLVCLSGFIILLIYINELPDNLKSNLKPVVDDTSMILVGNEPVTTSVKLNKDLENLKDLKVRLSPSKKFFLYASMIAYQK